MEREKLKTFINRQEKKPPHSQRVGWRAGRERRLRGGRQPSSPGGPGGEERCSANAASRERWPGNAVPCTPFTGSPTGTGMPEGAERQSSTGAGHATAASARAGNAAAGL